MESDAVAVSVAHVTIVEYNQCGVRKAGFEIVEDVLPELSAPCFFFRSVTVSSLFAANVACEKVVPRARLVVCDGRELGAACSVSGGSDESPQLRNLCTRCPVENVAGVVSVHGVVAAASEYAVAHDAM